MLQSYGVACDSKDMEDRVNEDRDKKKSENIKHFVEDKSSSIDSINNNFISGFFEKFNNFHSAKIESDESSLPSPKAMLETIMPCENICNNFRQIADQYDALKTIIKTEMSEKKVSCGDFNFEKSPHFPVNLKSSSRCQQQQQQQDNEMKSKTNVSCEMFCFSTFKIFNQNCCSYKIIEINS